MPHSPSRRGRTLSMIGAVAATALASAVLATPADATSRAAVSVTFTDRYDAGIHDIHVTALRGRTVVDLGVTDAEGEITGASGRGASRLTPGAWTFQAVDVEKDRAHDSMSFAPAMVTATIGSGTTDLGRHALDEGATLGGSVYAPSGAKLSRVSVSAYVRMDDGRRVPQMVSRTGGTSGFALTGVGVSGQVESEVHVTASRTSTPTAFETTGVVRTMQPGQTDNGLSINDWQVRCDAAVRATSSRPGQVDLAVRSTADWAGVPHPGGDLVIKRGRTVVKIVDWSRRSSATIRLGRQPRGQKIAYTVSQGGGDCLTWTTTKAVRVHR